MWLGSLLTRMMTLLLQCGWPSLTVPSLLCLGGNFRKLSENMYEPKLAVLKLKNLLLSCRITENEAAEVERFCKSFFPSLRCIIKFLRHSSKDVQRLLETSCN